MCYLFDVVVDFMEAFASHPRLGSKSKPAAEAKEVVASDHSLEESATEQSKINTASDEMLEKLAVANMEYEKKFNNTFIACASGKSADQILAIISRRLSNTLEEEVRL